MKDIIIIGAGASGLFAAISALETGRNKSVLILEKNNVAGKKLSRTGNGRCNFTNSDLSIDHYNSDSPDKVQAVLSAFGYKEAIEELKKAGLLETERNGYFYPLSGDAKSFRDMLCLRALELSAEIEENCAVASAEKKGDCFIVKTCDGRSFEAEKLIVSAGGLAAPDTGSDGEAINIAKTFEIALKSPLPALCPLKCEGAYSEKLNGMRAFGAAKIIAENRVISEDFGELQFNKDNISGIPVLNISSKAVRLFSEGKNVEISIDLLPKGFDLHAFIRGLDGSKKAKDMLLSIINYKAIPFFLKKAGIEQGKPLSYLSDKDIKRLYETLSSFTFKMTGYPGYDRAQTSSGGVLLSEMDIPSLETKKVKGLYFTGEALDCDGRCGGYNLQWAWSTGYLSGRHAAGGEIVC